MWKSQGSTTADHHHLIFIAHISHPQLILSSCENRSFIDVEVKPHALRIRIAVYFESSIRDTPVKERVKGHSECVIQHAR